MNIVFYFCEIVGENTAPIETCDVVKIVLRNTKRGKTYVVLPQQ